MRADFYPMIIDTVLVWALLPTLNRYFLHLQGNLPTIFPSLSFGDLASICKTSIA